MSKMRMNVRMRMRMMVMKRERMEKKLWYLLSKLHRQIEL